MKSSNTRLVLGIVLVIIGFFMIADNVFYFPFHVRGFIFSWPVILFVIGILIVSKSQNNGFGYILIGIGILGFIHRFMDVSFRMIFYDYWPIILIAIGLYILINRREHHSSEIPEEGRQVVEDYIDESGIFSAAKKRITSQNFRGGKITNIFGSTDLDFAEAQLAEGTSIVDVFAMFGGMDIYVPNNWKVIVSVTSIFGGFEDKRYRDINAEFEKNKILVIKGTVIFGGGKLKSTYL